MSGLSDFLTHATAPWWSALLGTAVGSAGTIWGGTILERVKNRNTVAIEERKAQREEAAKSKDVILDLGTRLLTECWRLHSGLPAEVAKAQLDKARRSAEEGYTAGPAGRAGDDAATTASPRDAKAAKYKVLIENVVETSYELQPLFMLHHEIAIRLPRELAEVANDLVLLTSTSVYFREIAPTDLMRTLSADYHYASLKFANALRLYFPGNEPLTGPLMPHSDGVSVMQTADEARAYLARRRADQARDEGGKYN